MINHLVVDKIKPESRLILFNRQNSRLPNTWDIPIGKNNTIKIVVT